MHFKGVFVLILLVCVAFTRTGAQVYFDETDMIDLVKSIILDPEFRILKEQDQIGVLREVYAYIDIYTAYTRKKHIVNFM